MGILVHKSVQQNSKFRRVFFGGSNFPAIKGFKNHYADKKTVSSKQGESAWPAIEEEMKKHAETLNADTYKVLTA